MSGASGGSAVHEHAPAPTSGGDLAHSAPGQGHPGSAYGGALPGRLLPGQTTLPQQPNQASAGAYGGGLMHGGSAGLGGMGGSTAINNAYGGGVPAAPGNSVFAGLPPFPILGSRPGSSGPMPGGYGAASGSAGSGPGGYGALSGSAGPMAGGYGGASGAPGGMPHSAGGYGVGAGRPTQSAQFGAAPGPAYFGARGGGGHMPGEHMGYGNMAAAAQQPRAAGGMSTIDPAVMQVLMHTIGRVVPQPLPQLNQQQQLQVLQLQVSSCSCCMCAGHLVAAWCGSRCQRSASSSIPDPAATDKPAFPTCLTSR